MHHLRLPLADALGTPSMVMKLNALVLALAVSLLVAPLTAEAQQTRNVRTIGFLGPPPSAGGLVQAFQQGLRDLGYVEGQNIRIEYRYTDVALQGHTELFPRLAAELVRLKPDVLVVSVTEAALAAKNATSTKGFQLLKEALPETARVNLLANPTDPLHSAMVADAKDAAKSLGVQLKIVEAATPAEIEGAFSTMHVDRAGALLVVGGAGFYLNRTLIVGLALRNRLPSVFQNREFVEAGGLLSYAPSTVANYRRAATYVDKILKGAKPADLPVEQPTKFELVINLKTAKALGLTIPQPLLLRADEVIQ